MSSRIQSSVRRDLLTVCWELSDSGSTVTQFLFQVGEPCAHLPEQARIILSRLFRLEAPALDDLCTRLARLRQADLRFWGEGEDCELCAFLRRLSADVTDSDSASDDGASARSAVA